MANLVNDIAGVRSTQWISPKDNNVHGFTQPFFKVSSTLQSEGEKISSFQDHIHVYTKTNVSTPKDGGFMIPFHKDSGFILFLTPFPLHPLVIKDKYGETLDTDGLKEDSVIVILGTGISEWLLGGTGDR